MSSLSVRYVVGVLSVFLHYRSLGFYGDRLNLSGSGDVLENKRVYLPKPSIVSSVGSRSHELSVILTVRLLSLSL